MQAFRDKLKGQGYRVRYINFMNHSKMDYLFQPLRERRVEELWMVDPVDDILKGRIEQHALQPKMNLRWLSNPGFLSSDDWLTDFFKGAKHFSMAQFYIAQRKSREVLVEGEKPLGGKWSFDPENREKIPKRVAIPKRTFPKPSALIEEAKDFVERNFPENPGTTDDFFYPVTHREAERWFRDFLEKGLRDFGDYQDAMMEEEPFLFHSLLSPLMNIGLLTPENIIKETLAFAAANPIPLNSLEGFIRQIIGWREFMRVVYVLQGSRERTANFFRHKRILPRSFYTGNTGIGPVDIVIQRLNRYAYAHHIERLMILGNFMLLCEIDPNDVYRWFMEMFIDSYDWVMVPNVYGMSQHADGGLITTKPYISSSNYIRKMSDFPAGDWCEIWDGLYWRFIHKHRDFFEKNPRMKVMTNQLDRMGKDRLNQLLAVADRFLEKL